MEMGDDMMEPALDDAPLDDFDGADAEAGPMDEPQVEQKKSKHAILEIIK